MSKIMLVEDDNNLREIYEARLAAEGYEIVSAPDGEAALALGVKEKPDLIIADIMMPKVSGFDMLDIMRTTAETKNAKIIMMTALNQAEDKAKAEQLGADLYLVKSQVTLEDVVRSAKKLLGEENPLSVGGITVEQPAATPNNTQNVTPMSPGATTVPGPLPTPPAPAQAPAQPAPAAPVPTPVPVSTPAPAVTPPQPVAQPAPAPAQPTPPNPANASADTKTNEEELLQKQIEQFITEENPTISTDPTTDTPPAPAQAPAQPAPAAPVPTPVPVSTPAPAVTPPQPVAQPAPAPQAPAVSSSILTTPPSGTPQNDPQVTALDDDLPSGQRVIQKSAAGAQQGGDIAQNAEISGRRKVIKPISDVLTKGPNLDALLAEEKNSEPGTAPTINSVVSPEGITSTPNQQSGTMNDVIAPNPAATPKLDPNNPPAPPVA